MAMDMQDVLFALFFLLPGIIIGVSCTVLVQCMCAGCLGHSKTNEVQIQDLKEKKKNKKLDDDDDLTVIVPIPADVYISSTGRIHKTPACSNMKSSTRAQLCGKCFKVV